MQIVGIEYKLAQKTKIINKHYEEILRMTGGKDQLKITDFKKELKQLGNEIGKILKVILKNLAFEITKDCTLALALDDETVKIPWELGLLPKYLTGKSRHAIFCDAACIGRLRVVKDKSWLPSPKKGRTRRALVIGINYKDCKHHISSLEHAEEEAEAVKTVLEDNDIHVTLLLGKKANFNLVTTELKRGVDIFHFTGHGRTSWNKSKICLYDKDLWAESLGNLLANSAAPSLSFFNACETSVDIYKKGKVSWAPYSWAFALANQGGSVFIGTMWSVLEPEALSFAKTFYQKFLGTGEYTLAEAMRQARNKIKRGKADAIFSWPAYVLYGPPTFKRNDLFIKS
jgi:CHAT domain-containing protein